MESKGADFDEIMMDRCEQLAELGHGHVSPNPKVGCVVTHHDKIVAEGYHKKFGGPHAEVWAIRDIPSHIPTREMTIYVSLEPCSHHGKTPPCAELISQKGFERVVIGSLDPNPSVSGAGVKHLESHGIQVDVLGRDLFLKNPHFATLHVKKRPFVTLKWAESADGFMGRPVGSQESRLLSGRTSNLWVHQLRAHHDALLIGANTLTIDHPKLTTRHVKGASPIPIILSNRPVKNELKSLLKYHPELYLFTALEQEETVPGIHHTTIPTSNLTGILNQLAKNGISSVLVEGGAQVLTSFLQAGLWDEAYCICTPQTWGKGISSPNWPAAPVEKFTAGQDVIHRILNKK